MHVILQDVPHSYYAVFGSRQRRPVRSKLLVGAEMAVRPFRLLRTGGCAFLAGRGKLLETHTRVTASGRRGLSHAPPRTRVSHRRCEIGARGGLCVKYFLERLVCFSRRVRSLSRAPFQCSAFITKDQPAEKRRGALDWFSAAAISLLADGRLFCASPVVAGTENSIRATLEGVCWCACSRELQPGPC